MYLFSLKRSTSYEKRGSRWKCTTLCFSVIFRICTKISGSSVVPNSLERGGIRYNGLRLSWSDRGAAHPRRCRSQMPQPGYVSRDTLRRIFAITKVEGDSIQASGKAVRDARLPYRFSRPRILPPGYFSPRNMLIIRAPVTFLYYIGPRYALSRRKDGRRKFIISPQLRHVIYVRRFDSRGFRSRRARPTSAIRRAFLFSYNVARFRREENLCATNDDSARTLILTTRAHEPSIFQRFYSRGLLSIRGFPRSHEKSPISKLSYIWLSRGNFVVTTSANSFFPHSLPIFSVNRSTLICLNPQLSVMYESRMITRKRAFRGCTNWSPVAQSNIRNNVVKITIYSYYIFAAGWGRANICCRWQMQLRLGNAQISRKYTLRRR